MHPDIVRAPARVRASARRVGRVEIDMVCVLLGAPFSRCRAVPSERRGADFLRNTADFWGVDRQSTDGQSTVDRPSTRSSPHRRERSDRLFAHDGARIASGDRFLTFVDLEAEARRSTTTVSPRGGGERLQLLEIVMHTGDRTGPFLAIASAKQGAHT